MPQEMTVIKEKKNILEHLLGKQKALTCVVCYITDPSYAYGGYRKLSDE
jgi:hypothetical protein